MATKSIRLSDGTNTLLPESASSGSGYQKSADGTLMCWGTHSESVNINNSWNSVGYYGRTNTAIIFPIAFVATPKVFVTTVSSQSATIIGTAQTASRISGIFCWRPASSTYSLEFDWIAIGRWK